jgi:hypothetical protein
MRRILALASAAVALAGCATLRDLVSAPPRGEPSGRPGWLVYDVGGLRFEAPESWRASGGDGRVKLEAPDGGARLEASIAEERFADEKTCIADAEDELRRGEAGLERVRRHPTTFAGKPGISQEADASGWHGWAYGICDGGVQYRIFFAGRSPLPPEVVEVYRTLVKTARVGGEA